VKIPNNRRKNSLLILFLILCVLGQPVLSSAVLCFAGSDHVEVEMAHDSPASFSQCQVTRSPSSQTRGIDVAAQEKEDQCFDIPMSGHLALTNTNSFDQASPQTDILTQEASGFAFCDPRTWHGNTILSDLLPFEASVSSSLQNTILLI